MNVECPDGCDDHVGPSTPEAGSGAWFTCPNRPTPWRFVWCVECSDWNETTNTDEEHTADRLTYCDPSDHGFFRCDGARHRFYFGGNPWVHEDMANHPCYGSTAYCNRCYDGCDCSDCDPPDYDDDYCDCGDCADPQGEEQVRCGRCNTYSTHLDLISEFFLCDCAATETLRNDKDHPILFSAPINDFFVEVNNHNLVVT